MYHQILTNIIRYHQISSCHHHAIIMSSSCHHHTSSYISLDIIMCIYCIYIYTYTYVYVPKKKFWIYLYILYIYIYKKWLYDFWNLKHLVRFHGRCSSKHPRIVTCPTSSDKFQYTSAMQSACTDLLIGRFHQATLQSLWPRVATWGNGSACCDSTCLIVSILVASLNVDVRRAIHELCQMEHVLLGNVG